MSTQCMFLLGYTSHLVNTVRLHLDYSLMAPPEHRLGNDRGGNYSACISLAPMRLTRMFQLLVGGLTENQTRIEGFADLCIIILPSSRVLHTSQNKLSLTYWLEWSLRLRQAHQTWSTLDGHMVLRSYRNR